jgi:Rps23 Pro-64 3,4-dihydroxylase Tpa1-like proline 4-hydroxylase
MIVIDDFLSNEEFTDISTLLCDPDGRFPWYYFDSKVYKNNPLNFYDYGFVHSFYSKGRYVSALPQAEASVISPVYNALGAKQLIKVKANVTMATPLLYQYDMHTDVGHDIESKTAVFYLNTNDGYTLFEDGSKVDSVANRVVIFDEKIRHAGTSCTNAKRRVVLNVNYI